MIRRAFGLVRPVILCQSQTKGHSPLPALTHGLQGQVRLIRGRSFKDEERGGGEEQVGRCLYTLMGCLTALGFIAFTGAGGNEEDSNQKLKSGKISLLNGWGARLLPESFVVSAAKPLNDNEISQEGSGGEDVICTKCGSHSAKGEGRRSQFNFIADVLEAVQDAVVCIEVKDHSRANWFGHPEVASNGSGFIVKEDGLILTNAHVVASQQRTSISVKLRDGRCYAGVVEHIDYESDLATVRVNARRLPTLKLGCSATTRLGEWVVAVGSPLNLANTVTAGVVSSTRRGASELGIRNDIEYIQTDAAITFGNSGGPLINLDGEAIGINSMKVTPGISFAIPIDHAKKFLEWAETQPGSSKSHRRYMGLTILSLDEQIRKELETRTGVRVPERGVFVWQVIRGGPAFLAGLLPGDVITSINGREMISSAQVHEIIKTDDVLIMDVQRGGRKLQLKVVPENVAL